MNIDNITYFDSFGIEYISKEMKSFIRNKNIAININRNKHIIQLCVDTFALNLMVLCWIIKD